MLRQTGSNKPPAGEAIDVSVKFIGHPGGAVVVSCGRYLYVRSTVLVQVVPLTSARKVCASEMTRTGRDTR